MEKITYKNILPLLKSKAVLMVAGGLVLASCTTQAGGYTETDGVYYDPNRDTLPVGTVAENGNQVGEYYDYKKNDNENVYLNSDNRKEKWSETQGSDWGTYQGTDVYYDNNWGYPYSHFGSGFGMTFGWGSPWSYYGYYSPWSFGYNPWYGYYSPFYSYSPYGGYYGYNPYYGYNLYGYYSPYGYGYPYNSYNGGFSYKRSGSDDAFRNTQPQRTGNTARTSNTQGFRNTTTYPNSSSQGERRAPAQPRFRNTESTSPRQSAPRPNTPDYEPRFRTNSSSSDGGGFRSGGFSSGSSSSSSSSTRSSGGFRR